MLKDIGKIKILVTTQRSMELVALQCYPIICIVLPLFSKFSLFKIHSQFKSQQSLLALYYGCLQSYTFKIRFLLQYSFYVHEMKDFPVSSGRSLITYTKHKACTSTSTGLDDFQDYNAIFMARLPVFMWPQTFLNYTWVMKIIPFSEVWYYSEKITTRARLKGVCQQNHISSFLSGEKLCYSRCSDDLIKHVRSCSAKCV